MSGARFTKLEISQRRTAEETLASAEATVGQKYHAKLLLKSTKKDAEARSAAKPDAPVVRHRAPVPSDPKAVAFLAAVAAVLENGVEGAEVLTPETPAASLAPRAPEPKRPPTEEICDLCLIPKGRCGHLNQSQRGEI